MRRAFVSVGAIAISAIAGASTNVGWHVLPMYGGGYVQDVIICPSKPNVWYTFVDVGGPYRSDDAGKTWRALHGNISAEDRGVCGDLLRSLSVDPRDEDNFVCVSGAYFDRPAGIYVSRDGGQNFRKAAVGRFYGNGDGTKNAGNGLARDPFVPDKLLAAGDWDGIQVSTDNGETWSKSGQLEEHIFCDIRFDRVKRDRVYACSRLPADAGGRTYQKGFYISEDGAATWRKIQDEAPYEVCQIAGRSELLAYFPDSREMRISADGGETWSAYAEGLPKQETSGGVAAGKFLAFGAGRDFWLCGDSAGSIFRRKPGEAVWTAVPHQTTKAGNLTTEPRMTWISNCKFDALGSLIVDPKDDSHWLATDFYEIWETVDAGTNWTTRIQGIMQLVSHTIEFDPFSSENIIYGVADMGLFWSADGGKTFHHPGLSSPSRGWIYACSASYSRKTPGLAMLCGGKTDGIVLRSTSHGHYWIDPALRGLPKLDSTNPGVRAYSIAADPSEEAFYICLSGPVGEGKGGIYKTKNGGDDWEWAGDGLPEGEDLFRHGEWSGGGVYSQIFFMADGSAVCNSSKTKRRWYRPAGTTKWLENNDFPGIGVYDPFRPGRMLAGAWPIRETLDGGKTWHRLDTNIGQCSYVFIDEQIKDLVVAGLPDRTVWLSRDGGHLFQKVEGSDKVPSGGSSKVVIDRGRMYLLSTGSGVWTRSTPILPAITNGVGRLFSDAAYWFRGGYDKNGNGKVEAQEIVNSARPKFMTAFQGGKIYGDEAGVQFKRCATAGCFTAITNDNRSCISVRQGAAGSTSVTIANPFADRDAGYRCDEYTVMMRFRWDGSSPDSVPIFNMNNNWQYKRGWQLSFKRDGDNYRCNWSAGRQSKSNGGIAGTFETVVPGFTSNVWFDVAVTCRWGGLNSNSGMSLYWSSGEGKAGSIAWPCPWGCEGYLTRMGIEPGDALNLVPTGFSGDIAQFAIWPRILAEDEIREAFAADDLPADVLWRVGYENGKGDEFSTDAAYKAAITAGDVWDEVPAVLGEGCGELSITFQYPTEAATAALDYVVRIVPADDQDGGRISLAGDVNGSEIAQVKSWDAATIHIPLLHERLRVGENTFRLRHRSGVPLRLDAIEAVGSWQLGIFSRALFPIKGYMTQSDGDNHTWYNLWEGYRNAMHAGWSRDSGDASSVAATTWRFVVPPDMVRYGARLSIGVGQFETKFEKQEVYVYLNGTQLVAYTPYQYEIFDVEVPAGTLQGGENALQVRCAADAPAGWWGGARGYRLALSGVTETAATGLSVFLR